MIKSPMIKELSPSYDFLKDGLSQSLMSQGMQCPRKFAIATHKLAKPPKMVMELGSYGHAALEHQGKLGTYKLDKSISSHQRDQINAIMRALIPAYFKYWKKDDAGWKCKHEHVFDFVFNKVRLRGKIDGILQKVMVTKIRETKFKSRISEDGLERALPLDWQSLMYVFAYTQEFKKHPKGGVEYDVVRYPSVKDNMAPKDLYEKVLQGVNDEPENWFHRWITPYSELDVMTFTGELIQKLKEFTERKVWYRNECACNQGYVCDYIDYCTMGDKSGFIIKELFSELKK